MPKGVKIEELRPGSGRVAERGDVVRISFGLYLNRGELIRTVTDYNVNLGRRDTFAGLRYGIEGMREGGVRRLRVSPHLGYSEGGLPDLIPANAVLIFEVELLEVLRGEAPAEQ